MVTLPVLLLTAALSASPETTLLHFTADWCAPCRVMEPTVQRLEDEGYPIRRINIDQNPQLARQFRIEAVPCFVLVQNGRELDRVTSVAGYDRLVQLFDGVQYRPAREAREIVRAQSPDDDAAGVPADAYAGAVPAALPNRDSASAPNSTYAAGANSVQTLPAEQAALAASVRIKVLEENGHSFGTGTIIDTHGDEALVVTCGHLFRESQGRAPIEVELLGVPGSAPLPAQMIEYHADSRDIALIAFRPGVKVTPVRVAPDKSGIQMGAPVFSIGCDHGGDPSIARSHITGIDRYINAPNIEVAGMPVLGRSGGGLFTMDGMLIGICNAADEADDEGIYAGLPSIHWQLDQIGLSRVYQNGPAGVAASAAQPVPTRQAESAQPVAAETAPPAQAVAAEPRIPASLPGAGTPAAELLAALADGSEVICVIRKPDQKDGRVLVLDGGSRDLLMRLAREMEKRDLQPDSIRAAAQSLGNIALPRQ